MRPLARAIFVLPAIAVFCAAAPSTPAPSSAPAPAPSAAPISSIAPVSSAAPAPSARPGMSRLDTPYYGVETDLIITKRNDDFSMPHKVTFSRPGSDATSDRAEGNTKRGTVTLFGNVVVHDNGNAPEAGVDAYSKGGPSTLTCDELDVDSKAKIYTAIGHVHFEQGARLATAQHAVMNRTTGMLRLEGDVKTKEGESSMTAQDFEYNTNTKKFAGNGKPIVIKQPIPAPEPGSATPTPKPKKKRPF